MKEISFNAQFVAAIITVLIWFYLVYFLPKRWNVKQKKEPLYDRYNYKGADAVPVVIIEFYDAPDYILHKDVFDIEGGISGLIFSGHFEEEDYFNSYPGTMKADDFYNLSEWEG